MSTGQVAPAELSSEVERPERRRARGGSSRVQRGIGISRAVLERLLDVRRSKSEPEIYVRGETNLRRALARPAILGFLASVAIVVGASLPSSPFTWKAPGAWFLGNQTPPFVQGQIPPTGPWLFFGVVAVFAGMALMIRAWCDIVSVCSHIHGIPIRQLFLVFVAWTIPLLVVAPLFSRDLYSYAAQGEMMTRGINPYHYGPAVLGATPFVNQVDPLWQNVTSPYGPVFLSLAGIIVSLSGHQVLPSVEGLRLLAVAGTVAFSLAVPSIARSFKRDGASAFALVALNPLVLLHLIGGGHNDALMLGFLVPGYALSRRGHPVLGAIMCGLGAAVKIPALIGAVYIGWEWLGPNRSIRERARPVATALLIAGAVMAALSEWAGLGWGFIAGLSNPDTVVSWLDPPTGLGLFAGKIAQLFGFGDHTHILVTLARGSCFAVAIGIALWLLLRSDVIGPLRALGWSCIAIVVLSPTVQPWYLTWGIVFIAPIADGRIRRLLLFVSGVACFLGLPGGRVLLDELVVANPILVITASLALVGTAALLARPWLKELFARRSDRELAT